MGNMFRCTLKSGGASGTGIPLIVTCSEDFAGKTITATDGTTTLTETCPSTSPYTVQFDLPNTGSWTISGVIEGQTYSETIAVTEYQLNLNSGFDYKAWLTAGGLDPTDYANLAAVFADQEATRRLMLKHDSADYLISSVTDDITVLDDFVANDTAMKWLGLCDYVCDGLTAITGVEAKLLASTYWEGYLKDHVPVMTSDSAPYGAAISSGYTSGYNPYRAFDGNSTTEYSANSSATSGGQWLGFKFTNPISVRKIFHLFQAGATSTVKVQYSDDGTNYTDTGDTYTITRNYDSGGEYIDVTESGYHLYWRVYCTSSTASSDFGTRTLQFYGRALNVSVPVMTSNTAPYGQVISTQSAKENALYYPFRGHNNTSYYVTFPDGTTHNLGYKFSDAVIINRAHVLCAYYNKGKIQYSDDNVSWNDATVEKTIADAGQSIFDFVDSDFTEASRHKYWRFFGTQNTSGQGTIFVIQFYGLDYSEKEFEAGTTKKWLYDHGVELVTLEEINRDSGYFNDGYAERKDSSIKVVAASANYGGWYIGSQEDLTDYSLLRAKIDGVTQSALDAIMLNIRATKEPSSTQLANATYGVGNSNLPNNLALDISSINQTCYAFVGVGNNQGGSSNRIFVEYPEWWLE